MSHIAPRTSNSVAVNHGRAYTIRLVKFTFQVTQFGIASYAHAPGKMKVNRIAPHAYKTLDEARAEIPGGLIRHARDEADDKSIIETWI